MDTDGVSAASKESGNNDRKAAIITKANANDVKNNKSTGVTSEDFLIFGARPSHLFNDISITIDSLLTEEVTSLPLLPRTLTESEQQQAEAEGEENKPQTGEEKLIAKLRKAYQRNIDLAEAYCARNIFTVQYHDKTKRRKILENYIAQDNEDDGADKGGKSNNEPILLPVTTFSPPYGELPSPDQIMGMDKEIVIARQRLKQAKKCRIQLTRQLDRLTKATQTLTGVQEALIGRLEGKGNGDNEGNALSMQKLQESVLNAVERHKELTGWNSRAEEVLQILDKIKMEREGTNCPSDKTSSGNGKKVVGREEDERGRKRMWAEMGGATGSHGPRKQELASLLKKLRGN